MSPPQHPRIPRPETQRIDNLQTLAHVNKDEGIGGPTGSCVAVRIDNLQTLAHVNKDEGIGGPTGSCVAVPAFRPFVKRQRFPFDHGDPPYSPAYYRSAYLHAVETAMKAIEDQERQAGRPTKPQMRPGRIIRG